MIVEYRVAIGIFVTILFNNTVLSMCCAFNCGTVEKKQSKFC